MFEFPSYLVQVGWNGHLLAETAVKKGFADGAILSPSDHNPDQNEEISATIREEGGTVLFDPQFYLPRSERDRLHEYGYFSSHGGGEFETESFRDPSSRQDFCKSLVETQAGIGVDAYTAPSRLLESFAKQNLDAWLDLHEEFDRVVEDRTDSAPVFASLPVDSQPLVNREERERLLNHVTTLDVDGFYVSIRYDLHNAYPLTGVSNLFSTLDLLQALVNNGYEVIVGHTHHVAHLFFGVGIDAFASGHYKNLRSFDTRRWDPSADQGGGRLVVNYYSQEILNDLRVDQDLDLLYQVSPEQMRELESGSPFESPLFEGEVPSQVGWQHRDGSWDHYIWACHQIAEIYRGLDPEEREEKPLEIIEQASDQFAEVTDEVGMLSEPEEEIYQQWRDAYQALRNQGG